VVEHHVDTEVLFASELFENFFRFLGIVTDDRELNQIIRDAGYVKRLEVDARFSEPARDIGEHACFVLEQYEVDFTFCEAYARLFQRAACDRNVVRENSPPLPRRRRRILPRGL